MSDHSDDLPVPEGVLEQMRRAYFSAPTKHGLDAISFWAAWPSFHAAILALPSLALWRKLPDEFRWTLVPRVQSLWIPLPDEFKDWCRANRWLLDDRCDESGRVIYPYGFEIERRARPRAEAR